MESLRAEGDPAETNFYDDLPAVGRAAMDVGLCRPFLHQLDLLVFKIFAPLRAVPRR
jgi:hypothetical protein